MIYIIYMICVFQRRQTPGPHDHHPLQALVGRCHKGGRQAARVVGIPGGFTWCLSRRLLGKGVG